MRLIVMSDLEGSSRVDDFRSMWPTFPEHYARGCESLAGDINAAVRGLRAAGVQDISAIDGHGWGGNIRQEQLEPNVPLLGGVGALFDMAKTGKLREYDGLVMVGWHAMEGTRDGFLTHTNTGYTALRMNGRPVGEIEEFAWLAGMCGVPTLFVAGDAAAVREAEWLLPGVETAIVKTASNIITAHLLAPSEVEARMHDAARRALSSPLDQRVFTLAPPIQVEAIFMLREMADATAYVPRSRRVDSRTVSYVAEDYWEALCAAMTLMDMAGGAWNQRLMSRLRKYEPVQAELRAMLGDWALARLTETGLLGPPYGERRS